MGSLFPPTRFLFGPGPTQIEPRVYEAMSKPVVGYLDPFFFQVNEEVRTGLQQVFGTKNEFTLAISGTGSAGMEAAVSNFVDPGTKFLVFSAGYFAERIAEMGRRHGADLIRCEKPWGEVFTEAEAREAIERERPQLVAFVHAETSSGALQAPLAITRPAHEFGALVLADCVTSLGAAPINVDASDIDMAFSCTQKGLSCPPGLAPFTIGPRAEERLRARKTANSVWYLDLKMLMEYYGSQHRYHHTAPVSSFYALREGLAAILDEGVEKRFDRHARMHRDFVRRIEGMGLQMHVPDPAHRIPNLNTVRVPEGFEDAPVRRTLLAEHNIEIAGGFGPLAGKIFRIGIMGPLATPQGLDRFFGAFERSLAPAGAPAARM